MAGAPTKLAPRTLLQQPPGCLHIAGRRRPHQQRPALLVQHVQVGAVALEQSQVGYCVAALHMCNCEGTVRAVP